VEKLDVMQLRRRVERLTERWNRPDGPGVAVGVVRDGAFIVQHQAGMASLELGIPIGPDTAFRVASVSKQFTCAAVLMLEADGKLSAEDPVRQYIPELPDYGSRLTVAHLMHNTSGIRDMLALMRLGGADLGIPCKQEDLLAAIFRQRALNFAPGSRYLYSNASFLLLGVIAERVSGEPLAKFLERRIFAPAGMNFTRHTPSTAEIVPGLATGYAPLEGGGWKRAAHAFPLGGEGGLVSSVKDLALWDRALTSGQLGAGLAGALEAQTNFSNGRPHHYARGLAISHFRGLRTVQHGGDWPGYRTQFVRVPEAGLTIICISNAHSTDSFGLANDILDAALAGRPSLEPRPQPPAEADAACCYGRWLDRASGASMELLGGEKGPIGRSSGGDFRLVEKDGRFVADRAAPDLALALSPDGDTLEAEFDAGTTARYHRVEPGAALPADLAGVYENAELAASWTIAAEGEATVVRASGPLVNNARWELEPVEGDCIRVNMPGAYRGWLDVRVLRNPAGAVTGLVVDSNRARNLKFARVP
jgi:CubicO group peptidase (beta-lactamase class C family)